LALISGGKFKKMMKINLELCLMALFITISFGLQGQANYKIGSVITLNNDTLSGLIRDGGGIRNRNMCVFKSDADGQMKKYYPGDIKSYRFQNGNYYYSHEIFFHDEYKNVFIEVLLEGSVSAYYDRRNKSMAFYIEKGDGKLIGLENKEVSTSPHKSFYNQKSQDATMKLYLDTLQSIFKDSKPVLEKLNEVSYQKKDIVNITKEYIHLTCKTADCIHYEKDLATRRNTYGFFTGAQFSKLSFWSGQTSPVIASIPVGIYYNIPMPLIDERLSLQVELIYNYINFKNDDINFADSQKGVELESQTIGVPLLLRYQLPSNKITPYISLGKETAFVFNSSVVVDDNSDLKLHQTQKGGWLFDLGLNYKTNSKISFFTNIRLKTHKNVIVSSEGEENRLLFNEHADKMPDFVYRTNSATLHFGVNF
jgi:hypothetical protein